MNKDCLEPENNSKCCFFKIANAFLLLSNLLLIILGFHYMPTYISQPDSGYFSVLVATLGILVTLLIGWNIYTIIDVKQIREENNSLRKEIQSNKGSIDGLKERINREIYMALSVANNLFEGEIEDRIILSFKMCAHSLSDTICEMSKMQLINLLTGEAKNENEKHRENLIILIITKVERDDFEYFTRIIKEEDLLSDIELMLLLNDIKAKFDGK